MVPFALIASALTLLYMAGVAVRIGRAQGSRSFNATNLHTIIDSIIDTSTFTPSSPPSQAPSVWQLLPLTAKRMIADVTTLNMNIKPFPLHANKIQKQMAHYSAVVENDEADTAILEDRLARLIRLLLEQDAKMMHRSRTQFGDSSKKFNEMENESKRDPIEKISALFQEYQLPTTPEWLRNALVSNSIKTTIKSDAQDSENYVKSEVPRGDNGLKNWNSAWNNFKRDYLV
ncbi:hypothetical protein BC830DRAFT_475733 [Chytriomyces sp. MP71]|nr:hypothetical protein BC830DRAFT_475733 [Chytriomyces sp. MP71]